MVRAREVLIPWRGVHVLPELAVERERTRHLAGLARFANTRVAAIGHDCIPMTSGVTVTPGMTSNFAMFLAAMRYSDRIAVTSHASAAEFTGWRRMVRSVGLRGPDLAEVGLPVQAAPSTAEDLAETRRRLCLAGAPLVLVVGSHEPRKNHLAVLHACELLWREGLRFNIALVGSGSWKAEPFRAKVAEGQGANRPLDSITALPDEQLWAAYRLAHFVLFPSLNEGFGLPAAEALACGTPVITSRFGSMADRRARRRPARWSTRRSARRPVDRRCHAHAAHRRRDVRAVARAGPRTRSRELGPLRGGHLGVSERGTDMSALRTSPHVLAVRLRGVVDAVGWQVAGDTPGQLRSAVAELLETGTPGALWLTLSVLRGRFPDVAQVEDAARSIRLDGAEALLRQEGDTLSGVSRMVTSPRCRSSPTRSLSTSITLPARTASAVSSGSLREIAPRWQALGQPVFVGWSDGYRTLRPLTAAERGRLGLTGPGPNSRARLVPWRGAYIAPELTAEPPRARALQALGFFGRTPLNFIGYDCIPVTSGGTVAPGMSTSYLEYLAAARYAHRVSVISEASAGELLGWRRMARAAGSPKVQRSRRSSFRSRPRRPLSRRSPKPGSSSAFRARPSCSWWEVTSRARTIWQYCTPRSCCGAKGYASTSSWLVRVPGRPSAWMPGSMSWSARVGRSCVALACRTSCCGPRTASLVSSCSRRSMRATAYRSPRRLRSARPS